MHLPSITSAYLALLALLYTVLAVQVGGCARATGPRSATMAALRFVVRSAPMPTSSNTCPSSR